MQHSPAKAQSFRSLGAWTAWLAMATGRPLWAVARRPVRATRPGPDTGGLAREKRPRELRS
eukprot:2891367-Lingulodinium_polyedra.AAC.1